MNRPNYKIIITRKPIKNMYMRIKGDTVYVTAPYLMPQFKIDAFISSRSEWIAKHLDRSLNRSDDGCISYRGKRLAFKVIAGHPKVQVSEDGITVCCKDGDSELALKLFYKWGSAIIMEDIRQLLPKYLPVIQKLGYYGKVDYEVRLQKSLWGICYPKRGLIRLSSRLIHFDQYQVEAVLWHELLHFIVPNHSRRFHDLATFYMSDYEKRIRSLKL